MIKKEPVMFCKLCFFLQKVNQFLTGFQGSPTLFNQFISWNVTTRILNFAFTCIMVEGAF